MKNKVYVCLILYGLLSQGIYTSSEENIRESSNLQIRRKRVIDQSPNGSRQISIREAFYLINILANGISHCAGSILSANTFLTAAHCFRDHASYSMLSGSPSANRGIPHNITEILFYQNYSHDYFSHDLALVVFHPHIDFRTSRNRPIKLFNGNLPPNSHGTITSWGCFRVRGPRRTFPHQLRSITVPIINNDDCENAYHNQYPITIENICTFDSSGLRRCNEGDSGAPLVVSGRLVGCMTWNANSVDPYPDVFVNLLHLDYRNWILSHVPEAA